MAETPAYSGGALYRNNGVTLEPCARFAVCHCLQTITLTSGKSPTQWLFQSQTYRRKELLYPDPSTIKHLRLAMCDTNLQSF